MLKGSAKKMEHDDNPPLEAYIAVGNLFREARETKGVSVQDIATSIHIRRLYLEAIESGDFHLLPGQVYTIGFIRSYANFLNLDSDEILRQLDFSQSTMKPHAFSTRPLVEKKSSPLLAWGLLGLFVFTLFALYFFGQTFQNNQEDQQDAPEVLNIIPEKTQQTLPPPSMQEQTAHDN